MGKTFETREATYDFYDWMKKPKTKKYLDKIPLEIINISLRSNGLNPKSVCLYNGGGFPNCHCNTCIEKVEEHKGLKKGQEFYFDGIKVRIKSFCPLKNCCDVFIKGVSNEYFFKNITSEEVHRQLKLSINNKIEIIKQEEQDILNDIAMEKHNEEEAVKNMMGLPCER